MTTGKQLRLFLTVPLLLLSTACAAAAAPASQPELEQISASSTTEVFVAMREQETSANELASTVELETTESEQVPLASSENAVSVPTVLDNTYTLTGWVNQILARNRDTVGWLYIPDTTINTAVVKNPENQNNYYLQHSFDGSVDPTGTFCADFRVDFGLGARADLPTNTTIYAHSFDDDPDSTLFSQLKHYRDEEFARSHPYIHFSTASEDMVWEVFAVYDTTVHFPYVWPELPSSTFREVMELVSKSSLYDFGITITPNDKLLTLSTCTFLIDGESLPTDQENDYRFVVMARLTTPQSTFKETAELTVNPSPLSPNQLPALDLSWIDTWEQ